MRITNEHEEELTTKLYALADAVKRNDVSVFVENDPQNLS